MIPDATIDPKMDRVGVVAIVPAWMLADGAYVGLGVGERVTTGLALAVTDSTLEQAEPGLEQSAEQPGFTTLRGRVECPADAEGSRVGTVVAGGPWVVVPFVATPLPTGAQVAVSGWLTAEPYLWEADGALACAVPHGRREWRVTLVRRVGETGGPSPLDRLPTEAGVDPDAAYLLDLAPVGSPA
jgi:hypothetical protein